MLDWGYHELIMWQNHRDRLREAEENRLARQTRPGCTCGAMGTLRYRYLGPADYELNRNRLRYGREQRGAVPP